jgi:hypothetical protein
MVVVAILAGGAAPAPETIELCRGFVRWGPERFSVAGLSFVGNAHAPFFDASLPPLDETLCRRAPAAARLSATLPWNALDVCNVVAVVEQTGAERWSLTVAGRACGTFTVLAGAADIEAGDLVLAETVHQGVRHVNVRQLRRRTGLPLRRVALTVDMSTPVDRLCRLLAKVEGDAVHLNLHSGSF